MPTVSIDGVALHYEVCGSASRTLVLAHAYPTNRTLWAPQIEALSKTRTVVAYDLRGFGQSDAPDDASAYSPQRSVDDLAALVEHLGAPQVDLCGLSMGGNVALNYALAHPERVASLIVSGTGAGSDDPSMFAATTHAWAEAAERDGIEAFAAAIAANPIFAEYCERGPAEKKRLHELIVANSVAGVAHTAREVLAKRRPINALVPRMRALPMPTLVVIGDKDAACVAPAEVMTAAIPRASFAAIPGTGHFNNLEAPAMLNALLESFLA